MPLSLDPKPNEETTDDAAAPPSISLPRRIDTRSVANLHADIRLARGAPLTVIADEVEMLGAQGAALFFSAAKSWAADGLHFEIKDPSETFVNDLSLLGLSIEDISAP
ncbi:MAG: STAS domain-containing protein [Pseudomonadota bacterium]